MDFRNRHIFINDILILSAHLCRVCVVISFSALTTKWWLTDNNGAGALYGQPGILHNPLIWRAFKGTMLVAVCCALIAGTIGTLIGYAVSKNRRSKWANYVNGVAFLPYLMPSLAQSGRH